MGILFLILFLWVIILQLNLNDVKDEIRRLKITSRDAKPFGPKSVESAFVKVIPAEEKAIPVEENIEPFWENSVQVQENIEKTYDDSFDFEKVFLGNIFNKVGALALIIGVCIFIKLISPFIVFTPLMKIITGFLAGGAMIAGAVKLHKDDMKSYAEVLMGTGFAILFITTYCATNLFHIFNTPAALVVSGLILVAAYYVADKNKTVSMLVIGLIGGYLNPFFIGEPPTIEFLFGYLILLNALSLLFTYRNEDKSALNFLNLIMTTCVIYSFSQYNGTPNIFYPLVLWLMYLAFEIFKPNNMLNWLNFAVLTLFSILVFRENYVNIASLLAAMAVMYAGLAIKKKSEYYVYSLLVAIFLSTYFFGQGALKLYLWSIEGMLLAYAVNKYKLNYLANGVIVFFSASITTVFFVMHEPFYLIFGIPILSAFVSGKLIEQENRQQANLLRFSYISLIYLYICFELNRFLVHYNPYIRPMVWAIIGYKYSLQSKRLYSMTNYQVFDVVAHLIGICALITMLAASYQFTYMRFIAYTVAIVTAAIYAKWTKLEAYKYLAAVLGFFLVHLETLHLAGSLSHYLVSTVWILYAGTIILVGIFKEQKFLKNTGICISILATIKIFMLDLYNVDMLYKLIAFLFLGVILMIVSYFYSKYKA